MAVTGRWMRAARAMAGVKSDPEVCASPGIVLLARLGQDVQPCVDENQRYDRGSAQDDGCPRGGSRVSVYQTGQQQPGPAGARTGRWSAGRQRWC